jgi:hypothetical protein
MHIRLRGNRDGIETAAAIREQFAVPIVFMSGCMDRKTHKRARDISRKGYLLQLLQILQYQRAALNILTITMSVSCVAMSMTQKRAIRMVALHQEPPGRIFPMIGSAQLAAQAERIS